MVSELLEESQPCRLSPLPPPPVSAFARQYKLVDTASATLCKYAYYGDLKLRSCMHMQKVGTHGREKFRTIKFQ